NFRFNSEYSQQLLKVFFCVQGKELHCKQYNIDFSHPAMRNEGNFIAILQLLAKQNPILHDYLTSGAKNAKFTSKTIQNKIFKIAASDQI
ncbi:MAG: DUF4371 domain-containing protein, partial [Alphaproteobacteria bacterium]|nr:DUF4371 domain-containing protein [Alphaproteobacteria bacterium]